MPLPSAVRTPLLTSLLLAVALFGASPRPGQAEDNLLLGLGAYVVEPQVATQLRLTEDQISKLNTLMDRREGEGTSLLLSAKGKPADEINKLTLPFRTESEKLAMAILTESQRELLRQAAWTRDGLAALSDPELAKRLSLTEEQQSGVASVLADRQKSLAGATGGVRDKLVKSFDTQLLELLTAEQQAGWREAIGMRSPRAVAKRGLGGSKSTPAPAETANAPAPAPEPAVAAAETPVLDSPKAPEADDAEAPESPESREPVVQAARQPVEHPAQNDGLIYFNFRNQPWPRALEWFAEAADVSLVMDAPPTGTFNYADSKGYTPDEAIDVLNGVLLTRGYTVIRRDRMLMVINLDDGIPPNLVPQISPEELATRGNFELVKVLFPLTKISPDEAEAEISKLLGPQGNIVKLPRAREILVTETGGHLRTIQKVLNAIESPQTVETVAGPLTLKPYTISRSDPQTVYSILATILEGQPGVKLTLEPSSNKIIAFARPSQHASIQSTIDQLEMDGREFDAIQLRNLDTTSAVLAINNLFGGDKASGSAPHVEAEPNNRQLLIRGSKAQIAEIRALLAKMGEGDTGTDGSPMDRGNIRQIPLTGRSAQTALEQIEAIWPGIRKNKIRVVNPSAIAPSLRDRRGASYEPRQEAEPNEETGRPETSDRRSRYEDPQTKAAPRRSPFQFAVQNTKSDEAGDKSEPSVKEETNANADDAPPIYITFAKNGIMISSEDKEALDQLEMLLRQSATQANAAGRDFTVYYLKSATAATAAEMLTQIFNGGAASGGGSSLLGDLASSALGDAGGGMMSTLLGLGGGGGEAISLGGSLMIVPDPRLNALIVHGNPKELDTVEQLLEVLDQADAPETLVALRPRLIPVVFSKASDVADVVKQVYQDRLVSSGGAQRQPSPEDFIRMLGGSRGGRSSRSGGGAAAEQQKMSIGVDSRTNSLVVNAPEPLFQEVKELVLMLDEDQPESAQSVKVVTLKRANSDSVQKALKAILGENLASSGSTGGDSSSPFSRSSSDSSSGSSSDDESRRRREEFFRSRFGSSSGFGGFGGFGGSSDRGSSDRGRSSSRDRGRRGN